MEEIKIGDKYKGLINNIEFTITDIKKMSEILYYKTNDNRQGWHSIEAFKHCLLEKIN